MTLLSLDGAHESLLPFDGTRDYTGLIHREKAQQLPFAYDQPAMNFDIDAGMQALDTYDYDDFDLSDSTDDWLSIAVDMEGNMKDFDSEVSYVQLQQPTRKRKLQPKCQAKLKKTKVSKTKRSEQTNTTSSRSVVKSKATKRNAKPDVSIALGAKSKAKAQTKASRMAPVPLKPLNCRTTAKSPEATNSMKTTKKDKKTKTKAMKSEENDKTMSRSRVKSSMYRGVSRCAKDGRWQARIRHGSKVKYLGRFKTEYEAALCYDNAAKLFHGVRATTNF